MFVISVCVHLYSQVGALIHKGIEVCIYGGSVYTVYIRGLYVGMSIYRGLYRGLCRGAYIGVCTVPYMGVPMSRVYIHT